MIVHRLATRSNDQSLPAAIDGEGPELRCVHWMYEYLPEKEKKIIGNNVMLDFLFLSSLDSILNRLEF